MSLCFADPLFNKFIMIKITGHCIVKNEDRWVWFALQSVLPFCEEIFVYDTGSTDKTVSIIKSINSSKIKFEKKGLVTPERLVELRKEQLKRTKTDWFLIIDGDEVWPEQNLKKLIATANSIPKEKIALFNRVRNCVGDIYHYLPESAGRYKIGSIKGHLNIRLIRNTPGLDIKGVYPLEAYTLDNTAIQDQVERLEFVDTWLLHMSFLKRSSSDKGKVSGSFGKNKKAEKGIEFKPRELPEILFDKNTPFDSAIQLNKRSLGYETAAYFTDPLIKLKRLFQK